MAEEHKPEHETPITPEDHGIGSDLAPKLGDMVRRAVMAGMGAVFLTEEGIRKTVSELKLPKEALGYISSQAERTRHEASRVVRKEVRRFLNSDAFRKQVQDFLSGITLEIKAEIRLKPAEGGVKPDIDATMDVKQAKKPEPAT